MAKPLNKFKKNGVRYCRREPIEALLDELICLPDDELVEQCKSTVQGEAGYIPSECLVYIIRESIRKNNQLLSNPLLHLLLDRCKDILANKISKSRFPDAMQLRLEILGKFSELIATDCLTENQELLDYYEVNFNHAFQCFRINNIRSETKELEKKSSESVEIKEETGELHRRFVEHEVADKAKLLPHEKIILLDQLWCFIRTLPEEQQITLMLFYIDGYTQEAIAAMTDVTDRTVRKRLRSAENSLQDKIEDKP